LELARANMVATKKKEPRVASTRYIRFGGIVRIFKYQAIFVCLEQTSLDHAPRLRSRPPCLLVAGRIEVDSILIEEKL
jgi:hypothetical protein